MQIENLVDIEFGGDDIDRVFDALATAEALLGEDAPVPRERYTIEQAIHLESEGARARLQELARILPNGPPSAGKRILRTLDEFVKLHNVRGGLGGLRLVGKERQKEGFVSRLQDFIQLRVLRSCKLDKEGQPLLDGEGRKTYMASSTLRSLRILVTHLIHLVPMPVMTMREKLEARTSLIKFEKQLKVRYGIKTPIRKRIVLRPIDIRGLIEEAFRVTTTDSVNYNFAIQDSLLLLCFLYTGARPGSILKTAHYPDLYSRWKDVVLVPQRSPEGQTMGFEVKFSLTSFKGHHQGSDLNITFRIRPTVSEKFSILDLGNMLVAHGIRCGVFGNRTLEDLLQTDALEIRCEDECKEDAIFKAKSSRSYLSERPLNDGAATRSLQQLMRRYGIAVSGRGQNTFYCTRRGFASAGAQNFSRQHAKFLMGHMAHSSMFESVYDQSWRDLNMTENLLGASDANEAVILPLSATRHENPVDIPRFSLKEALERQPIFRSIATKVTLLEACLLSGSNEWLLVEPFKTASESARYSNAHLPYLIAKYKYKLKTIVRQTRANQYNDDLERAEREQEEQTYQLILARQRAMEDASDLVRSLQGRLWEQERAMLRQGSTEEDEESEMTTVIQVPEIGENEDEEEVAQGELMDEADVLGDEEPRGQPLFFYPNEDQEEDGNASSADVQSDEGTHSEEDDGPGTGVGGIDDGRFAAMEELDRRERSEGKERSDLEANAEVPGQSPAPADSPLRASREKLQMLRALVSLEGATDSLLCSKCIEDDTAPLEMKRKRWVMGERRNKHMVQYHESMPTAMRWLESCVKDDLRWHCPFRVNEGVDRGDHDYQHDPMCGKSWSVDDTTKRYPGRDHIVQCHQYAVAPDWIDCFRPETRGAMKRRVQQRLEEFSIKSARKPLVYPTYDTSAYLIPGALQGTDMANEFHGRYGLGASIWGTARLDPDTSLIPGGWLDSDGNLRLPSS